MNCRDVNQLLADFHSGDLSPKDTSEVLSHLSLCPQCARDLEALKSEEMIYGAYAEELDRSLEVSPQLWNKVQAAIAVPKSRGGWRYAWSRFLDLSAGMLSGSLVLRQAAFAALIVATSVGATLLAVHFYRGQGNGLADQPVASERLGSGAHQYSLEAAILSIQRAERDYNDAIRMLSRIVDKRKPSLDPDLVAEVERNLRAIDESIAATRAAYHAHPADPELAHYMLTAYEKKVELLLELAS